MKKVLMFTLLLALALPATAQWTDRGNAKLIWGTSITAQTASDDGKCLSYDLATSKVVWKACGTEVDGVIGNEVTNATDATLTRSGSGTAGSPYTLGLNLGNANTWTVPQTFNATLAAATGNEVAMALDYTVNKATSGNDTGLLLNMTDTRSPGASLLLDLQTGGVSKFSVSDTGSAVASAVSASSYFALSTSLDMNGMRHGVTASRTGDGALFRFFGGAARTNTSGTQSQLAILPSYNQTSGTASNTDLLINRTETAVGSGAQYLIDAQVDGASRFSVTNAGAVTAASTITAGGAIKGTTIQLTNTAEPTCNAAARGMIVYVAGGAGAADTARICRKDAADAYAWVSIF